MVFIESIQSKSARKRVVFAVEVEGQRVSAVFGNFALRAALSKLLLTDSKFKIRSASRTITLCKSHHVAVSNDPAWGLGFPILMVLCNIFFEGEDDRRTRPRTHALRSRYHQRRQ